MEPHAPVLLDEALEGLNVQPEGRYLDATFGRGGHTAAVLAKLGPAGAVVAFDRDPEAIRAGRERFGAEPRLTLIRGPFGRLTELLAAAGQAPGFDGMLFDLGVSSPQLDNAARGFSFLHDGPLDMRMDNETGITAAAWLARAPEHEIATIIREYGEERFARRIASAIVSARRTEPLTRTTQLARVVAEAVPAWEPGKHPATRTFQAIRIHVNAELAEIDTALAQSVDLLNPRGRLCVISFHSLEDGRVKRFMQRQSQEDPVYAGLPEVPLHARPRLRRVGKAVHPQDQEIRRNPRARSAILRIAERLAA
ncbi:MAG: 16S rRNA (cytosine(1402)-N(4))-methyltransferase RsmH [Steroidobacteraceae bacterium]